jgi:hypothetical protein
MGAKLIALAALIARRQGPAVARLLLRRAKAWLEDPANEATRQALLEQLRSSAEKAGGAAGRLSARVAREVERRRVSVGAWERDLMALRYEIADMAPGPVREAALGAYAAQARAGVHLVGSARRPDEARRRVEAALVAEERMLRSERLSADERERALAALADALHACAATVPEVARR